jgi:hypothetical protein
MADEPLLLRALKHVWVALQPLNLPMAVMGGIAVAAWKHVRATQDVDLLDPAQAARRPDHRSSRRSGAAASESRFIGSRLPGALDE